MVTVARPEYWRKNDRRLPHNYVLLEDELINERWSEALTLLSGQSSREEIEKVLQDYEHKFSDVLNLATEKRPGYPEIQERVIELLTEIAVKCGLPTPSRNVKEHPDDEIDKDEDPLAHAIRAKSLKVVQRLLELGIVPNDDHVQLTQNGVKQARRIRKLVNETRAINKEGLRFTLHETVLKDLKG
ncbi:hypothetical protein AA0119_g13471 [Alternaria tenuissima]|uniref:Uncharacterized protein n=1 Tax=Alternaria tenuissima TaxID=119927 RepID=A0ABY0FNJ5_9PLEO|nr:hypothetical protein AA0119_g13471 [Alternaria tenuissima]RYO02831.1 hypothetical protein AA0121_g13243 [Alternaria tenuissima]RYO45369.1 hypothetical protein AA0116_g13343 [Alternaria tenuissima]